MNLVVGATGHLGGLIAKRLLRLNQPVRITVRSGSDAGDLISCGAAPVAADLKDLASLHRACTGIDVVITTANSAQRSGEDSVDTVDRQGNSDLIKAASEAGVRQFIFVSAFGATTSHPVPLLQAKAETEETLRASGMNYTILAPHIFMDVWIPMIVGRAVREERPVLLIGNGDHKHSFIAAQDVAAFAVASVTNELAKNRKLELGGPEAISWRDIIALVGARIGQNINVAAVPIGQPVPEVPPFVLGFLTGMEMADVEVPMKETAQAFGVQLTNVEQFIATQFPA
jgi:uncharacterized protein YbjT (DUF2867 family)